MRGFYFTTPNSFFKASCNTFDTLILAFVITLSAIAFVNKTTSKNKNGNLHCARTARKECNRKPLSKNKYNSQIVVCQ